MNLTSLYREQLANALSGVEQILAAASSRREWDAIAEVCFGQSIPALRLQELMAALPSIEVRSAGELGDGLGGFGAEPARIVLDERLLAPTPTWDWRGNPGQSLAVRVLLEEIGHYLDSRLNPIDTPGDEGALFAALLLAPQGNGNQSDAMPAPGNEDDSIVVELDGRSIRLEMAVLPVISLAVTPAVVSEAGPTNLIYTFTRTGPSDSALTVNFSVGGSAGYGSDYSQRGASAFAAGGGSISFTAGSSVAFLNLLPSTDGLVEADEIIALSLSPSSGYSLASTAASSGTILDNDQPGSVARAPIATARPGATHYEQRNRYAFAALKSDGSVVTWGDPYNGGNSSAVASRLSSGVSQIFADEWAFAALKSDGSVVTWGDPNNGGNSSAVAGSLSTDVIQISSTSFAFAALKRNGSVVTWGGPDSGGNSSAVASRLSSGVTSIFASGGAFAALKNDGSVVTWGSTSYGGDSSAVASRLNSGVSQIFASGYAFAALKSDGSVVTWGDFYSGGDSTSVASGLSSSITTIACTDYAFAALKSDGSVVTWGNPNNGGDSSAVASRLGSGVTTVFSNRSAFAALKSDGSVVSWGSSWAGGNSSALASSLSSGVTQIFSTYDSFAALKSDGSVVTWGNPDSGGDSSAISSRLSSGVSTIVANGGAYAALKSDGSVVTWGRSWAGGDNSALPSGLSSGVSQIFTTYSGFAALKGDGSVITWGDSSWGGDSRSVASRLSSGIVGFATPFTDDRLLPDIYTPGPNTLQGVNLGSNARGYALRNGSGTPIPVTYPGGLASANNPGNNWTAVAAAAAGDGYAFYWRNTSTQQAARWDLNSSGVYRSGYYLSASQLISEEASLNLDLNADGYTSGPSTIGGVNLGRTSLGYALSSGNGMPFQVTYSGGYASPNNPGANWNAIAAVPWGGYILLYWRNSVSSQVARWDLNTSGAYISGYMLSVSRTHVEEGYLNLDLDGDNFINIYTASDGLRFGSTSLGYALRAANGTPIQVVFPGGSASSSNPGNGWTAVAAALSGSGYAVYWRQSGTAQTACWELNRSGEYTSGSLLSASQLDAAEANLNLDINSDGFTVISSNSAGLKLGRVNQVYALRSGNAAPIQITLQGTYTSDGNPGYGWTPAVAVSSGSGYVLYWRNPGSNVVARWDLNSNGVYRSGYYLSDAQLISEEASSSLDLNGDGYTSGARTIAGVNLGSTNLGYALRTGTSAPIQVTSPGGDASATNPGSGWTALAAVSTGSGYAFYWRNSGSGELARWDLSSSGAYQSGALLSASQLINEEVASNADLNGDAIIGSISTTIESQGAATLLRTTLGMAAVRVGDNLFAVASPFGLGTGDISSEWQMLAAESVGVQNQILWRNNPGNFLHVWTLNSSWSWQSSSGNIDPLSQAALGLEANFQVDLNGNGVIG